MENAKLLNRLDLQQDVTAPAHIRRQRREKVHNRDCSRRDGDEQRERVRAPELSERSGMAMQANPPSGCVAPSLREITPVFDDQPHAGGGRQRRREWVMDMAEGCVDAQPEEDHQPEMPVVSANAEQEDPRAQRVAFDPEQAAREEGGGFASHRSRNFLVRTMVKR